MRRTLLAALLAALAAFLVTAAAALALGHALLACYTPWVRLPERPICIGPLWGAAWVPLALFAVATLTVVAVLVVTARAWRRQFFGAQRLRRRLEADRIATPPRLQLAADRAGITRITCVAATTPRAITIGAWRPTVLVTHPLLELLNDDELDAVLTHEAVHVRHHHPAIYGLARTAAAAAFPLPALTTLAHRIVLTGELDADLAATHQCGVTTLVAALAKLHHTPDPATTTATGNIASMLPARIHSLARTPLPPPNPPRHTDGSPPPTPCCCAPRRPSSPSRSCA